MELLKRATAIYLLAAATVIVAQLVFSPFYRNVVDVGDIWHVMNWFMAASIIINLVVRYHDKLQLDKEDNGGGLSRRYLEAYAGFVVAVFLALWFFWNWGDEFITSSGAESDTNSLIWAFINPLFVVVTGLTGSRLWASRYLMTAFLSGPALSNRPVGLCHKA